MCTFACAKGQQELEERITICECAHSNVLNLNQKLVIPDERFKCILPVIHVDETFLVGIKFWKKLLQQWAGQVKSRQAVLLVDESLEVVIADLTLPCWGPIEAFIQASELLRQIQAHLLDGAEFPVKGTSLAETATECFSKSYFWIRLSSLVRVFTRHQPLEIWQLDLSSLEKVKQLVQPVQLGGLNQGWINLQNIRKWVSKIIFWNKPVEISIKALECFFNRDVLLHDPVFYLTDDSALPVKVVF